MPDFSRGVPRQGQWVIWKDRACVVVKQTVLDPQTHAHKPEVWPPGHVRVELLDDTGFRVLGQMLVSISELQPLMDKSRIPAKRLATMDPSWTPRA